MDRSSSAYGLWLLVVLNSAIFISFARPRSRRDWRSFGAFSAFLVALFTEMYGFPLTIYLLSGWLQRRSPGTDVYSHDAGHLWESVFGWGGDPHLNPLHVLSYVVIFAGFGVLGKAWPVLYQAQRAEKLATTGSYAAVRHPQYVGFILIMLGFLLQWPTIVTVPMFPILVIMYVRLARSGSRGPRSAMTTTVMPPPCRRSSLAAHDTRRDDLPWRRDESGSVRREPCRASAICQPRNVARSSCVLGRSKDKQRASSG
jgi:protein-S-isoprenylcysteine O-methyltransferase Ste14